MSTSERIQKILAKAGIASRRKAEELITEGAVTVNGKAVKLGDKAIFGKDAIKVNGKLIHKTEEKIYVAFHKPKGVICAFQDPESRTTLAHFLTPLKARLFPIGRMDFNSEGLLLLTNDGEFSEKLSRLDQLARVYQVKVKGHLTPERIKDLERGARMEKRFVKPLSVRISDETTKKSFVQLVMQGPQSWDLKTYFEMKGFLIERILRSAIGHITLKDMKPGEFRLLEESQIEALLEKPELAYQKIEKDTQTKAARKLEERRYLREKRAAGAPPKVTPNTPGSSRGATARAVAAGNSTSESRPARGGFGAKRESALPKPLSERGARAPRGDFGAKREGGFGAKREGGFGAKREGGFGAKREGGFGAKREGGFGAKREGGFGAKREGGFGAKREGGFGAKREGGFGAKREGGFGARASFASEEREVRPRRAGQAPARGGSRLDSTGRGAIARTRPGGKPRSRD